MTCNSTPDFIYPFYLDIYYPVITQGKYNEITKSWTLDQTVIGAVAPITRTDKEAIDPEMFLKQEELLIGRAKVDIRLSSTQIKQAMNNILITNIRTASNEIVYLETSGPRSGLGTVYEVADVKAFVGPFGSIEYYSFVLRRAENQAVEN